jgi:hypothetical protein
VRYDRHNASRHSAFAKSDVAPDLVRKDPYLATVWALDCSMTTAETAARRRHRLDGELAKMGEEGSLSDYSANDGHDKATSAVAAAALCMAQEA